MDAIKNVLEGVGTEVSGMLLCPISCDVIKKPSIYGGRLYEDRELRRALATRPGFDPVTRVYNQGEPVKDGFLVKGLLQGWSKHVRSMEVLMDFYVNSAPDKEQGEKRAEIAKAWASKMNLPATG